VAVALEEFGGDDDEEVPELEGTASEWEIELGPAPPDLSDDTDVNRTIVFRAPGPGAGGGTGGGAAAAAAEEPLFLTGADFELHIEKALLQNKIGNIPQMSYVIPGQYTGSGWGIDRIGIVFDEATGKVRVFHLEMKFVRKGSTFVPSLGKTAVGTQTGKAWTEKAINGFLTNTNPTARAAQRRLRAALKAMYPNESIDNAFMHTFLHARLTRAPVRVVVPHWAEFRVLYKQIAALRRAGRWIKLTKFVPKK
jgi:hypothetical protein